MLSEGGVSTGDGEALPQLLECFAAEVRPAVEEILFDPEASRRELVQALRVWESAVFIVEQLRVMPFVQREAALLERQRAEMPADRFMKLAMRGVEWQVPTAYRILRAKLLLPACRLLPRVQGTLTFCIPVETRILELETGYLDPRAPDDEILRFFLALGDKTRLRILRLLAEREMYLTELSERLGVTKATTKHHMVILRATGFVILYERDRMTYMRSSRISRDMPPGSSTSTSDRTRQLVFSSQGFGKANDREGYTIPAACPAGGTSDNNLAAGYAIRKTLNTG